MLLLKKNVMKLEIEPYTQDPFEKDINFRVAGAANMNDEQLYALFVKNMIAFVYYETDFTDCILSFIDFDKEKDSSCQEELYMIYKRGYLNVKYHDPVCSSFLSHFCYIERSAFSENNSFDSQSYKKFINDYLDFFKRIDALINLRYDATSGSAFLNYLNTYGLILPYLNLEEVGKKLDNYFVAVCSNLSLSYISHLDESQITPENLEGYLEEVLLAMKYDLLDAEEQEKIITYSTRWITQRFKTFAVEKKMYYPIHKTCEDFVFEPFLQKFESYFSFAIPPTEKKDYPKHIFLSYEAYHLFDVLAQGLHIKVSVSYVYRLFFDKGLIVVKDTAFRAWYNQQDYPLNLHTATETLANSTGSERKQFVGIIAHLLGISI